MSITKQTKIYIAGHKGMVGSAVWRALTAEGYTNLIGRRSKELDLRHSEAVNEFYSQGKTGCHCGCSSKGRGNSGKQ